ncbi:MAG: hypothetical protein NUV94_01155 [Candidatus Acetothermia bacterium]|nr:hypothetical protein [Candidatus Acetothermia bacterium]
MYFATLTEVPILQGLLGSGKGTGQRVGLGLGEALSEVRSLGLTSDEGVTKELLSRVGRQNPGRGQGCLARVLLARYNKAVRDG